MEKTRGCYGAGLLFFHQYCNKVSFSEEDQMPASSTLLAGFAAEQARDNIQGDTIKQYLTSLHAWHFINDAPWHGNDLFVCQVLKGVGVLSAPKGSKPPRPPVSLEHIVALSTHLRPHDWLDAVIWVVACVAFWACCQLGELLPDAEEQFDPMFFPERSDFFSSHSLLILTSLSEDLHLPWTKTTRSLGADITVMRPLPQSPVWAMKNHLCVNAGAPTSSHLFSYLHQGRWVPLTKGVFMAPCSDIWASLLHRYLISGHSFRIGGATELLLAGMPPKTVASIG
ncbi:DNA breaking-rejoining enzyme [Coprinopsis sp. MPI-PUGE-AT-0042]|nr:DNA breaking-rejoining enzyme [Coprinopsis sp. MPI-PUGE-AT-0042]